jgi:hypothetical protein
MKKRCHPSAVGTSHLELVVFLVTQPQLRRSAPVLNREVNAATSSDIFRTANRRHILRIFSSSANVQTRNTQWEPTGVNRTCHPVGKR